VLGWDGVGVMNMVMDDVRVGLGLGRELWFGSWELYIGSGCGWG